MHASNETTHHHDGVPLNVVAANLFHNRFRWECGQTHGCAAALGSSRSLTAETKLLTSSMPEHFLPLGRKPLVPYTRPVCRDLPWRGLAKNPSRTSNSGSFDQIHYVSLVHASNSRHLF